MIGTTITTITTTTTTIAIGESAGQTEMTTEFPDLRVLQGTASPIIGRTITRSYIGYQGTAVPIVFMESGIRDGLRSGEMIVIRHGLIGMLFGDKIPGLFQGRR